MSGSRTRGSGSPRFSANCNAATATFDRYSELNSMQAELDSMDKELNDIVDEIIAEGIIIRDIPRGLVDFPHLRDSREVYLCWISGEERIEYWHETDRGFDHRQPL